ncbi:hypothetical protein [Pseudorhodobacter sp.]|uniref:hypothetical protein n=1 Tax=Pseudorhodobacter sp. TaxID=1934400 RepID=UPI002AFEAAC7|nr:hypothetical protein [Pseudorhodobacter sp.]
MISLFQSAPQRPVPKAALFGSMAALWGAPCVLGWMLAAALMATKGIVPNEAQLYLYGLVYLLVFSPVFSWVGWLLASPLIWFLLRDGWFGWASAALVGLVVGAVAGSLIGTSAAMPFGLFALLGLRAALGWTLPLGRHA